MADFCNQCSPEPQHYGHDLGGLTMADDTAQGLYMPVICEGCGPCQVDHEGNCVTHEHLSDDSTPKNLSRLPVVQ